MRWMLCGWRIVEGGVRWTDLLKVVVRWWSGTSASLRMLCGVAAISVSNRGRLASECYGYLAIVLLREKNDGMQRGGGKRSAGSGCT